MDAQRRRMEEAIRPAGAFPSHVRAGITARLTFEPVLAECILGNRNAPLPIHTRPWATLIDYVCKGGIRVGGCVGLVAILLVCVQWGFIVPKRIVNGQDMTFLYSLVEWVAEAMASCILVGMLGLMFGSVLGGIFYIIDRDCQGSAEVCPEPQGGYLRIYLSALIAVVAYVSLEKIPFPDKMVGSTTSAPGAKINWVIDQNGSGLTVFQALLGACLAFLLAYGSIGVFQRIMKMKRSDHPAAGAIQ